MRQYKQEANGDECRIDKRYLDTLMYKHERSQFLFKDTHLILDSSFNDKSNDIRKEFAKQCHKQNNALPIPSIVIQDWFRDDLYALMNVSISPEQSMALAKTFKHYDKAIKEICFADNNMNDRQFADLLSHIITDEKQYNDLQRITYAGNNELGLKTLEVLDQFIKKKPVSYPLTHISLVNCKLRIRTIEPFFKTL